MEAVDLSVVVCDIFFVLYARREPVSITHCICGYNLGLFPVYRSVPLVLPKFLPVMATALRDIRKSFTMGVKAGLFATKKKNILKLSKCGGI